jgi:hypothetical protein
MAVPSTVGNANITEGATNDGKWKWAITSAIGTDRQRNAYATIAVVITHVVTSKHMSRFSDVTSAFGGSRSGARIGTSTDTMPYDVSAPESVVPHDARRASARIVDRDVGITVPEAICPVDWLSVVPI